MPQRRAHFQFGLLEFLGATLVAALFFGSFNRRSRWMFLAAYLAHMVLMIYCTVKIKTSCLALATCIFMIFLPLIGIFVVGCIYELVR